MPELLSLFLVILAPVFLYWIVQFYHKTKIARGLIERAVPYQKPSNDHRVTLLVLGDSTAVGVGADRPEETLAGRIADYLKATYVENLAVSGSRVKHLSKQLERISLNRYDYILLQIGANDIIRFQDARTISEMLAPILVSLRKRSENVYLLSAGNIGTVKLFPPPLRPFHAALNIRYHKEFSSIAEANEVTYINLYNDPADDPFVLEPERFLSGDGLHPSSDGYGVWFERFKDSKK